MQQLQLQGTSSPRIFLDFPSAENEGTVYIGNVQELLASQNTWILNNSAVRTWLFQLHHYHTHTILHFYCKYHVCHVLLQNIHCDQNSGNLWSHSSSCSVLPYQLPHLRGTWRKINLKSLMCLICKYMYIQIIFFFLNLYLHKYSNRSTTHLPDYICPY